MSVQVASVGVSVPGSEEGVEWSEDVEAHSKLPQAPEDKEPLDLCEQTMWDPMWSCWPAPQVSRWWWCVLLKSFFTARLAGTVALKLSCSPQTASPVERFNRGNTESISKHFLKMGSRAMGRQSLEQVISACFGLGTMMDVLKHEGETEDGLECHPDPQPCGYSPVGRIGLRRVSWPRAPSVWASEKLLSDVHSGVFIPFKVCDVVGVNLS